MATAIFDVCRALPATPPDSLARDSRFKPAQGLGSPRAAPRPLTARGGAGFLRERRTVSETCWTQSAEAWSEKLASLFAERVSKTARLDLFAPFSPPAVADADAPPSYEDTLNDAPPDYTASDELATAKSTALDSDAPTPYHVRPVTKPQSERRRDDDEALLGKIPFTPAVDFSTAAGVREHKGGKKKKKQTPASWAGSDDKGKKNDGDGAAGAAPNGNGGDNAGGGGAGDAGGGGGGDDNNGDDDKKDDEDDRDMAPAGKKAQKKAKKKNRFAMLDDDKEDKPKEEEQPADDASFGDGDAGAAMPGDDPPADPASFEANSDDEWGGGWGTVGKKEKGKKGKNNVPDPVVPAPPTAAKVDGGDMTFEPIDVGNNAPKIDLSFGGADSKQSMGFGAFSWGASTTDWGAGSKDDKKNDAAKDAADVSTAWGGSFGTGNRIKTGFDFGFDAGAAATEAKTEDKWGGWDTVSNKKDKKKGKKAGNAMAVEDSPLPDPVVEPTPEPAAAAAPAETNPDDELGRWGPALSKKDKKKAAKKAAQATAAAALIDQTPHPNPATDPTPAVAEANPDDEWTSSTGKKDKKKSKGKSVDLEQDSAPVAAHSEEAPSPPPDLDALDLDNAAKESQPELTEAKAAAAATTTATATPTEANADDEWSTAVSKKDQKKKKGKGAAGTVEPHPAEMPAALETPVEESLPAAPVPPPAVAEPVDDWAFSWGTSKNDKTKKKGQQAASTGFDDVPMVQPDGVDEPKAAATNGDDHAADVWSVGKRDKKQKSDKNGAADDVTHENDPLAGSADVQKPDGHAEGEEEASSGWGVWGFGTGKKNKKDNKGGAVGANVRDFPPAPMPPGEMNTTDNHDQVVPPPTAPEPLAIEAPPPEDAWFTLVSTKNGKKGKKGKDVVEQSTVAPPPGPATKDTEQTKAEENKGEDTAVEPIEIDGITEPAPDAAAEDKKAEEKSSGWSLWGSSTTKKKTKKELEKEKKEKEKEKEKKEKEKQEKKEKEAAEKAAREAEEKAAKEAEEQEAQRKAEEEAEAARIHAEEEARVAEEEAKKKEDEEAAAKASPVSKKDKRKSKKGAKYVVPVVDAPARPSAEPEHVPDPDVSDPLTADAPVPAVDDHPPAGTSSTKTSPKLDRGDVWGASNSGAGGFWGVSLKKTKKGKDGKASETNSEVPAVVAADTGGGEATGLRLSAAGGADPFADDGHGHGGSEWAWPDDIGGEAHVPLHPAGDPNPVSTAAPSSPGSERKLKKKSGKIADRLKAFEAPTPPVPPVSFAQDPNELLPQAGAPPPPPPGHEPSLPPKTSAHESAVDNHDAHIWGDATSLQDDIKKSPKEKRAEKKAAKKTAKGKSTTPAVEPPVVAVPEPEPGPAAAVGEDDLLSPIPGGFPQDDVVDVEPPPPPLEPIVEPEEAVVKEKKSPAKSRKEKEKEKKKKAKSGGKTEVAAPVIMDVPASHNPALEDQPPELADPAINISDLPLSDLPLPAPQDENVPPAPSAAPELETKQPAPKSESSKKERPKVIRDKNAGPLWGFWGATAGPAIVRETVRRKNKTAADGESGATATATAATRTPVRGGMVRERKKEKTIERDDSKSSGSGERKNGTSRPKPAPRSSSFSFFGGATPMRSKSMREATPRSSAKTRRTHEDVFEDEQLPPESGSNKVSAKAARMMGLSEGEQRSAEHERTRLSRRHSTKEASSRRRTVRVPAAEEDEEAVRLEETSPRKSSRRKQRHVDVAMDAEQPSVVVDAPDAGPDVVMEDDAVFVEREAPAVLQSRRKREKKESRTETPKKSENGGGGGGLMGLFGLGSAKKKESAAPGIDERERRHKGTREDDEGRRRKRSRAADEDYAKRLRREQRRLQRSRPASEEELAPDTPAPGRGGSGETDPEEAEARRADRRARHERRKEREVIEDRRAKKREQQEQQLREEQEVEARRLQEEKQARRAARKEKEERRRVEAEEERKRIEAEETAAAEQAEIERERRERHARRRDRHGGGVSVESPSAHHSLHRPRTDSRRHSTRMEDDRDRDDRRRRHNERRAHRTTVADADADFKPSPLRRSHTEPVRDYFDPRNGTLNRSSSHRHHHHGGGGSGSAASGSDKTRSWVDQVNAEPPPPVPLAETIIDAPPAALDAAAALNPGVGAYADDLDRHELRRARKRDFKLSDERDRFYDPAAAAAPGYDDSGRRRRRRRRDDAEGLRSSDGGSGRRKRDSGVLWAEPGGLGVRTWDGQPVERPKGERKGSSWLKKIAGL